MVEFGCQAATGRRATRVDIRRRTLLVAESGHSSITHWEAAAGSRWGQYVTDHERTNLLFALERLAPAMALDVGCEGGRWSKLLLDYGWAVVATDVDSESLAVCPEASAAGE